MRGITSLYDDQSEEVHDLSSSLISVGIIERESITLEGLVTILNRASDINRSAPHDPEESIGAYIERTCPNVLIFAPDGELNLADLEAIRQRYAHIKFLLLIRSRIGFDVASVLEVGVSAIISKGARAEELLAAIRSISRGDPYLSPEFSSQLVKKFSFGCLTPRERAVLEEMAVGLSTKRIARRLGISEGTVKCHIKKIFEKLGAGSRSQAIFIAAQLGLLPILSAK
ncbi:DNA-binding response regulator [Undibacterium terreum]|uniref:DNA-binding response regulator n=2 Tax=Undibacterium terreum TaxID=1224302 RepID=A0A916XRZ9_9BURK|nr:DNA-binding response regulator [Undibacterium terreum]